MDKDERWNSGGGGKLRDKVFYSFYSSPNIVRLNKYNVGVKTSRIISYI